jgi:hypothetical protein
MNMKIQPDQTTEHAVSHAKRPKHSRAARFVRVVLGLALFIPFEIAATSGASVEAICFTLGVAFAGLLTIIDAFVYLKVPKDHQQSYAHALLNEPHMSAGAQLATYGKIIDHRPGRF